MDKYVIIVAGGQGKRMGSGIPKQFLKIGKSTILSHTINVFLKYDNSIPIIIVLPINFMGLGKEIISLDFPSANISLTTGGSSRFESVKSGLQQLPDDGLVAVHDAVRPMVSTKMIKKTFEGAYNFGGAIPTVKLKDSLREINDNGTRMCVRENFMMVQTPQTFRIKNLKNAYQQEENKSATDDSNVYENAGYNIEIVEGEYSNIKITTVDDLILMKALLNAR